MSTPTPGAGSAPFQPHDFAEGCEDCGAAPFTFCRPGCGSGYTAKDARWHAEDHRASTRGR